MSFKGYKASEETREKMRQAKLGRKCSDEVKKKMSEAHKGKSLSDEAKNNIRQGIKERRYTEDYAAKLSDTKLGEKNPQAVLSEDQVREIRQKYVPYKYSSQRLAEEYKVHASTIKDIIHNRTWTHIS